MKLSVRIRSQFSFFFSLTILTFRIQFMNAVNVSLDKITILLGDEVSTLSCACITLWQQGKRPKRKF